jgi:hypothetical protein
MGCRQGLSGKGDEKRGRREPLAEIEQSRDGSTGSAIMAHFLTAADTTAASEEKRIDFSVGIARFGAILK